MKIRNFFKHLHTINKHRRIVRHICFKIGIPFRGLVHDLSKYSPSEFIPSVKYFTDGKRSPTEEERAHLGYSSCWLHHKGRNKHHFEYWYDVGHYNKEGVIQILPIKMPYKYAIECFCDMLGASKAYTGSSWEPIQLWRYWCDRTKPEFKIHKDTESLLEMLFSKLVELGEKEFYKFYKKNKKLIKKNYKEGSK